MAKRIDAIDVHVGKRVRAYRLSRGMSQAALGEKIGVTFQQIQKYERGVNRMGGSRLKKVATALDVPVAALFGEDEKGGEAADVLTHILSKQYAIRLLRAFDAIKNKKERLALVLVAEQMGRGSR